MEKFTCSRKFNPTWRTTAQNLLVIAVILLSLAFVAAPAFATSQLQPQRLNNAPVLILRAEQVEGGANVYIPATNSRLLEAEPQLATIHVNYIGNWNPAAKTAVEFAKHVWETRISSPVVIEVNAHWEPISGTGVLGWAKPYDYLRQFSGAIDASAWYPYPLANKLANRDLDTTNPDIEASFNSAFNLDGGWYFGTDGKVDSHHWDFVSVVMHELGHGLGFSGSMTVSGGQGSWGYNSGYPFIFDRYTVNNQAQHLVDTSRFANPSASLATQLQSNQVSFSGSRALAANRGVPVRLYAPQVWQQGSSYSHLDESSFPAIAGNALMTPQLANGEAVHDPGPIALGIMADLGWNADSAVTSPTATPVPAPRTPSRFAYLPLLRKTTR